MKDLFKFEDLINRESAEEILDRSLSVGNLPMIIAMKGDAYTGKTTCADAIAESYRCSVIRFDTILDSIAPSLPPSPQLAHDLAFDIIVRVVKLQLHTGRPAVIDSPLSDPGHLDKLIQLADEFKYCRNKSCDKRHSKFVIVECKPEAKYAWELRFRNKCGPAHDKWYKPKEWNDVVFNESVADYPPGRLPDYVCRLIVNTTGFVNHRYLGAATLDLCECSGGHLLDFRDWLPLNPYHKGYPAIPLMDGFSGRGQPEQQADYSDQARAIICGDDGRHLLEELTTLDGHDYGSCAACRESIEDPPGYACKRCNKLVLHKSCAELEPRTMIDHPNELPRFLRKITGRVSNDEYHAKIPEEYRRSCGSCSEFSVECEACLWELHLRSGVVPTVLRHEGHSMDHIIGFWITSAGNAREYQCGACKETGWFVGYTCLHGTFRYNLHVECALLRRPWSHVQGGHHHLMNLSFATVETTDDFYCEECQEPRDPTAWYYSCTQCHFVSHLHCVYAPVDTDT